MLMLLFYIGEERYAIHSGDVFKVLPQVQLKTMPHLPKFLAGMMNYGGNLVPIIDLPYLFLERPCLNQLASRMILFKCNNNEGEGECNF